MSNSSTLRDYNRADQSSRISNQSGVVKQDPATNCIYPQGSSTGHFSAPRQSYPLYPSQRAYQMVAEEFKYKGTDNHPFEDFPNVGYAEEEPDEGNIFYTKEEFDELFVNFLSVESICHRCKLTFPSKSLMHKHLKLNYIGQNQENNSIAPPLVPILPFVIKSTASIKTIGFRYAFKDWNYVMATVCLTLGEILLYTDVTLLCCLDIGCGVTFVDRA